MRVRFTIPFTTAWGQHLTVCGSSPELGAWDPASALPLNASPGGVWEDDAGRLAD